MRKLNMLASGLILLSCIPCFAAETSSAKKEMSRTEKTGAVRLVAAALPSKAVKDWMTQGAWARWEAVFGGLTAPDGTSPILSDFFNHAILLSGTQNTQSGICAFYNPLQDNLLLLQTDNQERIPRIENFVFLTGTEFRGETLKEKEYPQAIAPVNGGLDEILLKNIAAVSKIFHADFPDGANTVSLAKYRSFGTDADKVASNASLRLALLERFTRPEANADALAAGEIALLLWKGKADEIKNHFVFPTADTLPADTFCAFPDTVRKTMCPVLYFKNGKETLFGFGSHLMPETLLLIKTAEGAKPLFVFLPLTERFAADFFSQEKSE